MREPPTTYVAFRMMVNGTGRHVPDAGVAFTIPQGATVWSHILRNHYEDQYTRRRIEEMPSGEWAGPPVTFQLKNKAGYASITGTSDRHGRDPDLFPARVRRPSRLAAVESRR